jgi:hypothetical protein
VTEPTVRRFSRPEMRFRVMLGAIWFGAVALVTLAALVSRPAHAHVPNKSAFYLILLTIPGVLLGAVMIKRRSILIATALLAATWSAVFSWLTMRSTRTGSGFGILVTPMIAFVIVGVGFVIDLVVQPGRTREL